MLRIGRIHILTDTHIQGRFSHEQLAAMAIQAGTPTLQYREKHFVPEKHLPELERIAALARHHHTQLIINDYVEVAAQIGAAGVHLGDSDLPIEAAMRKLPAFSIIGVTIHTLERYAAVRHLPIAYVGVGPVFATQTKDPGFPPLGIEGLRRFVEEIAHPVIAIGGITVQQARELFEAIPKLHGVAVLSAFCAAEDPLAVAQALMALVSDRS